MLQVRAAAAAAVVAVSVFSVAGSVLLFGQAAAPRPRRVDAFLGRRVISGEVLVRFRSDASPAGLASLDLSENERLFTGVRRLRARGMLVV